MTEMRVNQNREAMGDNNELYTEIYVHKAEGSCRLSWGFSVVSSLHAFYAFMKVITVKQSCCFFLSQISISLSASKIQLSVSASKVTFLGTKLWNIFMFFIIYIKLVLYYSGCGHEKAGFLSLHSIFLMILIYQNSAWKHKHWQPPVLVKCPMPSCF